MEATQIDQEFAVPIRDLHPYISRWVGIKGALLRKNEDGKRGVSVVLGDGTVKITLMISSDHMAMVQEQILQLGGTYAVKNFDTEVGSEGELILLANSHTRFIPLRVEVPGRDLKYVPLSQIAKLPVGQSVDVLSVVLKLGKENVVRTKMTGQLKKKRVLEILDQTNFVVEVTLWEKLAEIEELDSQGFPSVIAIYNARVADVDGKGLSSQLNTQIHVNPKNELATRLKQWFIRESPQANAMKPRLNSLLLCSARWKNLQEVLNEATKLVDGQEMTYISKVTVVGFGKGAMFYKGCPQEGCQKKVTNQDGGRYHCPNCNEVGLRFIWNIRIPVKFSDFSDQIWATCFPDSVFTLTGHSPDQLSSFFARNQVPLLDSILNMAKFKCYVCKFRAKLEKGNLCHTVLKAEPINWPRYFEILKKEEDE